MHAGVIAMSEVYIAMLHGVHIVGNSVTESVSQDQV